MAENFLITGYWGEPHVTSENDRGINAAMFGTGRFVLPVGEQFRAEYIGNNTIRIYDGKLMDNGAAAGITAGEYIDLLVPYAETGKNRSDLVVFQYELDASTLVEKGTFAVVLGTETAGTASDPELTQQDLLSNEATFDQMALYRVSVSGNVISNPVQLFTVARTLQDIEAVASTTTPKAPGTADVGSETTAFARGDHVHPEQVSTHGITTAGTGAAYTATVPGISSLVAGASFIMIPHTASTQTAPTLNVNSLGSKTIRRRLSSNTATAVTSSDSDWMAANKPITVVYDGTYWIADLPRTNANDIYGTVPVEKGGTGASTAADALNNLGAAAASHSHAASGITAGTLAGKVVANASAVSTVSTKQVRNIHAGTSDMTAGSSALTTGDIYFVYE